MATRSPRASADKILVGTEYGYWTVTGSYYRSGKNNDAFFPCECRCGTKKDVKLRVLREAGSGKNGISCGCYHKEVLAAKRRYGVAPGTKEWDTARRAWTKYRLEYSDYLIMVDKQNNLCAICSIEMVSPYIDHCHETDKVRGLLCHNCNTVLGHAKDNPTILVNAIKYLTRETD